MTAKPESSFWSRPTSRTGWWAVVFGDLFVTFWLYSVALMPNFGESKLGVVYGVFMILCGLSGGVLGSIAIIRKREFSWMVWLTLLPGAFIIIFLLGELIFPH